MIEKIIAIIGLFIIGITAGFLIASYLGLSFLCLYILIVILAFLKSSEII